jgi:hypothetical protein
VYSACLYCHGALGTNDVIEAFPVGACLGFDGELGRLWAICPECRRWNLSPIEERWEAVEQCERTFRETRQRVFTRNIGLARTHSGLTLVRIGNAMRPELAAWRYGRELWRRRLKSGFATGVGLAGAAGVASGGIGIPLGVLALGGAYATGSMAMVDIPIRIVAHVAFGSRVLSIRRHDVGRLRVLRIERGGGYSLLVRHTGGTDCLHDAEAGRALATIMPAINRFGADREVLTRALELIEGSPSLGEFVGAMYGRANRRRSVVGLPSEETLALEMALHEESERRALAGELEALRAEWLVAEEIAAIADSLLTPPAVEARIAALRGRADGLSTPPQPTVKTRSARLP